MGCGVLLTVGGFLLTIELLCLQLCLGAFLLTVGAPEKQSKQLFYRDRLSTLFGWFFGCFQCRALDGRRDCSK